MNRIYYSPSGAGFYTSAIHRDKIPDDAIEITGQQHEALVSGANNGQRIIIVDGVPTLVDAPPPSPETLAAGAREKRNRLLRDGDWSELPSVRALHTDTEAANWAQYRQALRDVPQQASFPQTIAWPTAPGA